MPYPVKVRYEVKKLISLKFKEPNNATVLYFFDILVVLSF